MLSHYVDAIAIIIFVLYLMRGLHVGLWSWVKHFIALIASLYCALLWFMPVSAFLIANVKLAIFTSAPAIAYTTGFLIVMIVVQLVVDLLIGFLFKKFPKVFQENPITHALGLIPAALEAMIIIVLLVVVMSVLPLPTQYGQAVADSYTGKLVNSALPILSATANRITNGHVNQALGLLNTHSENDEKPETLPYRPSNTSDDLAAEQQMLVLLNQSRVQNGLQPLVLDTTLTQVARAHSQDMWDRQYVSHVDPDGNDPFARMHAAGITFMTAGENIALAPTVSIAETGLMNSPGHRANILDKDFHKVGIGVIDGGIYGKMFTQDFTN